MFLLTLACQGSHKQFQDLEIQGDEQVVTRLHVRWTSASPTTSRVEFGVEGFELATPWESEPSTEHEAMLLGLPSMSTAQLRVVSREEGRDEPHTSEVFTAETGVLPSTLPLVEFSGEPHEGYTLAPVSGDLDRSVLILDGRGEVVWYDLIDSDDFGSFSAELDPEGREVVYMRFGSMRRVDLQSGATQDIDLGEHGGHHDLAIGEQGRVAYLGTVEGRGRDLEGLIGDTIVEVDEAGEHRVLWDVFEQLHELQLAPDEFGGGGDEGMEFSHGNALAYDPASQAYLVNLASLQRVVSVDAATGQTNWVLHTLGRAGLDFDPEEDMMLTHDMGLTERGSILMFANYMREGDCSQVVELSIDATSEQAEWEDSYSGTTCRSIFALGSAHPGPDEGALIAWATEGVLERVDEDNTSLSETSVGLGYAFGYSRHLDRLYPE